MRFIVGRPIDGDDRRLWVNRGRAIGESQSEVGFKTIRLEHCDWQRTVGLDDEIDGSGVIGSMSIGEYCD